MSKGKVIILSLLILGTIAAVVLYMVPWGEAKSEIKELEITSISEKVESESGVEINDINELLGVYATFDLDSSTSELMFSLDAMQGTIGKFKQFEIEFSGGETHKIMVSIDPSSVYTANGMRDEALLDEGFFEVGKFPSIEFESTNIELNDSSYVAHGTIKMLGIEKDISVPFTYKGKSESYKGLEVAIFEGKFTVDRTEYGMEHTTSIGDDVAVSFIVQLEKQNE